jgi:hypothetical protein
MVSNARRRDVPGIACDWTENSLTYIHYRRIRCNPEGRSVGMRRGLETSSNFPVLGAIKVVTRAQASCAAVEGSSNRSSPFVIVRACFLARIAIVRRHTVAHEAAAAAADADAFAVTWVWMASSCVMGAVPAVPAWVAHAAVRVARSASVIHARPVRATACCVAPYARIDELLRCRRCGSAE